MLARSFSGLSQRCWEDEERLRMRLCHGGGSDVRCYHYQSWLCLFKKLMIYILLKSQTGTLCLRCKKNLGLQMALGSDKLGTKVICHLLKHFVILGKSLNFSKCQFLICEMNRCYSANISNMLRVLQQQDRCIKSLCNLRPVRE